MAQMSPWAKLPTDQPLPSFADTPSPMSVWADPPKQPGLDLHAGLVPIVAPPPQAIPKVVGAEIPPEMAAPKVGKKYEYPAGTDSVDLPIASMPNLSPATPVKQTAPTESPVKAHLFDRLQKDYAKDNWNPEDHGVPGKIAHALNHATGGDTRRQWEEQGLVKQINDQDTTQSKNEGEQATTAKTKEETTEMPGKSASEEALQGAETAAKRASLDSPSLAAGYAHAVNQAIKEHRDPAQDPIVQHLSDAITSLQKESPGKGFSHVNVQGPNGKPILGNYNSSTGKTTDAGGKEIANPAPYEKPISVNVGRGEEHKEKGEIIKAYQPTLDSAERMNVMTENYEKAIKDHDQQAMLSLLANHLGMTMGLQKGSRLTRDIIREAQQSTPWLQGLQAKFDSDGYLTGVTLTPSQMRQMVGLGQSRYAEDAKKSRAVSQYLGATDDGPERSPGKATMRYYLGMTNGDPAKAKQIAAEDGWSVK